MCKLLSSGLSLSKHLVKYVRKVVKIEEEHSRALASTVRHFEDEWHEEEFRDRLLYLLHSILTWKSVSDSAVTNLVCIIRHTSSAAALRHEFAESLNKQLCDPLEAQLPDIETNFKQVFNTLEMFDWNF